ncbi:MAG: hypothetical protein JW954_01825 [Dehalococcoidaceae bacterium]|nr:hypothetical protein [Dehalococcoidaceae bacterium]
MKKPQYLSLVAIWQFFCAITTFFGILAMGLIALPVLFGFSNYWDIYMGPWLVFGGVPGIITVVTSIGLVFMLAYFVISLAAGIGTLQGKSWARGMGTAQAVLSIPNIPLGTVAGVLAIIYLGKPEVVEYLNRQDPENDRQPVLNPAATT